MKQWDIILFPFGDAGPHPAVILSADERCSNPDITHVNALLCTSASVHRPPKKHEAVLDENDGLDWKTMVRCDFIYALEKTRFLNRRGSVTQSRRRTLVLKIAESLRWPL